MAKTFYTERDVDDLKARGVDHLDVNDNVVLTDLAIERAMKHGIRVNRREQSLLQATFSPSVNAVYPREKSPPLGEDAELKRRVKAAVMRRLEGEVDEALLDEVIVRVLAGMS